MAEQDAVRKEALEVFFPQFMELLFPGVHAQIDWSYKPKFRDKELQGLHPRGKKGVRSVDKLVEVRLRDSSEVAVYVHVEVQGDRQPKFAERMFVYHYRIIDRYDGQVASLAVLTDDSPTWRPDRFENLILGCRLNLQFPVAKILDFRNRKRVLQRSNNPFAVLVLAQLHVIETHKDDPKREQLKFAIIRGLYDRKWSKKDIRAILKLVDGLIWLPAERDERVRTKVAKIEEERGMSIVTSFERAGHKRGRQEGRQEGELRMAKQNIMDVVETRFESVPPEIRKEIEALSDTDTCRDVLRAAIKAASIQDFEAELEKLGR